MGTLIFNLAIHQSIIALKSPLNIWYLDDGTVGGTINEVVGDIERLLPCLETLGLAVNTGKCEIFPCGPKALDNISRLEAFIPGIKIRSRDYFTLLGSPVYPDAVADFLHEKNALVSKAGEQLKHLSTHVALVLLRSCLL